VLEDFGYTPLPFDLPAQLLRRQPADRFLDLGLQAGHALIHV